MAFSQEIPNFNFHFETSIETPSKKRQKTEENTRFANFNESELQDILSDKQARNTKKATNWCVSTFKGKKKNSWLL